MRTLILFMGNVYTMNSESYDELNTIAGEIQPAHQWQEPIIN